VVVVGHKAKSADTQCEMRDRFMQNLDKPIVIILYFKHLISAPTSVHYMIPGV
jgi:hypothetical protein